MAGKSSKKRHRSDALGQRDADADSYPTDFIISPTRIQNPFGFLRAVISTSFCTTVAFVSVRSLVVVSSWLQQITSGPAPINALNHHVVIVNCGSPLVPN